MASTASQTATDARGYRPYSFSLFQFFADNVALESQDVAEQSKPPAYPHDAADNDKTQ